MRLSLQVHLYDVHHMHAMQTASREPSKIAESIALRPPSKPRNRACITDDTYLRAITPASMSGQRPAGHLHLCPLACQGAEPRCHPVSNPSPSMILLRRSPPSAKRPDLRLPGRCSAVRAVSGSSVYPSRISLAPAVALRLRCLPSPRGVA